MSEQRRAPGVRGTGEQAKPSVAAPIAAEILPRGELVADAQIIELEWIDAWSWRHAEPGFSAVSARGPPRDV